MITLEIPAPEFARRFQAGEIPDSARVTVTYEPTEQINAPASNGDVSDSWDEAKTLSGAELEAERRLFEQFEAGINQSRAAAEMRIL